jgi:formyltetrahydrofolate synthetase
MLTGGTKTIYSWDADKGEITQKTETVKSHSEVLKNPLINLNEEIQRLEELLKPFPLSYNRFATDCAKEVIAAEVLPEEGLSVSQPTKAIRPCAVCFILSFSCKSAT